MPPPFRHLAVATAGLAFCFAAWAQTATQIDRPPAVIPLTSEPAPKLMAYPPLAEALARGVVIIAYRTENMRVMPVFGKSAVEVSPRLGHLHVTVDDWHGTWAHTSGDPIILVGLKPGPHKMLLELADPNHKILASTTVALTVPEQPGPKAAHSH
jgi:Family of unknown function (DUF6130)